jgi:hypothetical protein
MSSPVDQAGMSGLKCSTIGNCAGTCFGVVCPSHQRLDWRGLYIRLGDF